MRARSAVAAALGLVFACSDDAANTPSISPSPDQDASRPAGDAGTTPTQDGAVDAPSVVVPATLDHVDPAFGNRIGGADVTVFGTNFRAGAVVKIGDIAGASTTLLSPTQLRCHTSRNAAGLYAVTVTNPGEAPVSIPNAFEVRGFVSVPSYAGGTVATFHVDAPSGALNATGTQTSPTPTFATAALGGRFYYVPNYGSATVSGYSVDPSTGALTALPGSPFAAAAGTHPQSIAADPSSSTLYVANADAAGTVRAMHIDATTGALSDIASGVANAGDTPVLAIIDPGAHFLFVTNYVGGTVSSYTIDAGTGVLTANGSAVAAGTNPQGMALHPSGKWLFVANFGSSAISVYAISATGTLSQMSGSPFSAPSPLSLATTADGAYLYAALYGQSKVQIFAINAGTGALSAGKTVDTGTGAQALAIDPGGKYVYVAAFTGKTLSTFAVTPANGDLTLIGTPANLATSPIWVNVW